jgi:hypothetical protein
LETAKTTVDDTDLIIVGLSVSRCLVRKATVDIGAKDTPCLSLNVLKRANTDSLDKERKFGNFAHCRRQSTDMIVVKISVIQPLFSEGWQ